MGLEGLAAFQNAPHLKRWGQELELAPNYLRESRGKPIATKRIDLSLLISTLNNAKRILDFRAYILRHLSQVLKINC